MNKREEQKREVRKLYAIEDPNKRRRYEALIDLTVSVDGEPVICDPALVTERIQLFYELTDPGHTHPYWQ